MAAVRPIFTLTLAALVLPFLFVAAGSFWQQTAIEEFASREGHHDLFQTWVGKERFDYTYDYRGNNLHYEIWAIRVPYFSVVGAELLALVFIGRQLRRVGARWWQVVSLSGYTLACLALFTYWSVITWWKNSGVFI